MLNFGFIESQNHVPGGCGRWDCCSFGCRIRQALQCFNRSIESRSREGILRFIVGRRSGTGYYPILRVFMRLVDRQYECLGNVIRLTGGANPGRGGKLSALREFEIGMA